MLIQVKQLKTGDRIMSDVFNQYGVNILSGGTPVTDVEIELLTKHQIELVNILPRQTSETTAFASWKARHVEANVMPAFLKTVSSIKELFHTIQSGAALQSGAIEQYSGAMISSIEQERDVVSLLLLLQSEDEYTFQHSVQVGMLSYFLARWLGYSENESQQIGNCGFLHDIGKSKIPDYILNKPAQLTSEEFEEIKKHTIYGHAIIKQTTGESVEAIVALQHHERVDGSGYPNGLKGDEIHPYAKIVAVADCYSAMTSKRVYKQKRDLLDVLKELYQLSFENLDPKVIHTFIEHMLPSFIGKTAKLNNGQSGEIIMINPTHFFRPLIKIEDEFIDLSEHKNLEIIHISM